MVKEAVKKRRRTIIIISISLAIVSLMLVSLIIIQIVPRAVCGNGICEMTESRQTCPEDCGYPLEEESVCGNGVCEKLENEINCPVDCGIETTECGDGVCEIPETIDNCPEDCVIVQWVLDYRRDMVSSGIPINYLRETEHFDYSSRNIREVVNEIREDSSSAEDAVKRTAREVFLRIDYTILPGEDCMTTPASEVLAREYGLCSTMSKVDIAILRGMGIAARPVTGCASISGFCRPLTIIGVPLPRINPIRMEGERGIVGGGIHAWVEVWLPEKGWVLLESTNGIVYEQNPLCTKYNIKVLDPQTMSDFCWISGSDYIRSCEDESLFE